MNYKKFNDEALDAIDELPASIQEDSDIDELLQIAYKKVFFEWIKNEKFDDLISWYLTDYDGGGGEFFLYELSKILEKNNEIEKLQKLWRGAISIRERRYQGILDNIKSFETKKKHITNIWFEKKKEHEEILEKVISDYIKIIEKYDLKGEVNKLEKNIKMLNRLPEKMHGLKSVDQYKHETHIKMDLNQFWFLLDTVKESSYPEIHIEEELKKLTPTQIISFQEHFDTLFNKIYMWDLWGVANIINKGCSDDTFTDFIYGIISKGKIFYEDVLGNPDSIAKYEELDGIFNESFGYVAIKAYEAKTGNDFPKRKIIKPPTPIGEKWDFENQEECENRLPKVWGKYGQSERICVL